MTPLTSLDGITVTGPLGQAPSITFKAPFAIDATRSKVLVAGTGPALTESSQVDIQYHGVNGYTQQVFDSSWSRGQSAQFGLSGVIAGFKTGLLGKHVGDRVLIGIPGKDGYDAQGGSGPGILVGDTLLFVVDILDTDYQTPYGSAVPPKAGLPTVTVDAKNVPSVAINAASAAPTAQVTQQLVAGSGTRKITADDAIAVHYRMYSWKTGKLLVDKYDAPDSGQLSDTIKCWKDGLVNQKLGSRVLLVCPPAVSYPEGSSKDPVIEKGDTVVFVVDLVWAQPTA